MQDSNSPTKIQVPWGTGAGSSFIRQVPVPSQIGIINGAASWTDGFVPLNLTKISAGGVPPFGQDMNGAFNQISAGLQWIQAGGPLPFDSAFSTSIGGYPKGALIPSGVTQGLFWYSIIDNNTSNPDTGGANWLAFYFASQLPLQANTQFYLNSVTGNDNNNGLTSGTAWKTLQAAFTALSKYYSNGFTMTLNISGSFTVSSVTQSFCANLFNLILNFSAGSSITATNCPAITFQSCSVTLQGSSLFSSSGLTGSGAGIGIILDANAIVVINSTGINFGVCAFSHIYVNPSAVCSLATGYTVSGSSGSHWVVVGGTIFSTPVVGKNTITLTGPLTFTNFASASNNGNINAQSANTIFAGTTPTGSRYSCIGCGVIATNGSGPNFLPGTVAGTQSSGGNYY